MKLLLINNLYPPYFIGGAEKVVQLLSEGLREFSFEPIILCTGPRSFIREINGIKIYYLYPTNIYWSPGKAHHNYLLKGLWHFIDMYNPAMYYQIKRIIKEEQPHLVHTHNLAGFSVSAWKAAKDSGLPLIHTLHDYYLLCPKSSMFKNNRNCARLCSTCSFFSLPKRTLSFLVDQVVGVSSYILERHCQAGYFSKSLRKVIYNPILRREPKTKFSLKKPCRFGYIGRLNQDKGVEHLLNAFIKINPQYATLFLAGTGETSYVSFLRRRYAAPNIFFLGFMPPDDFYEQIDILIVPSLWEEPLGMVVLEAISHGVPVIGSKRGGIPEVIDDGKTGFLFEPTEPDALARIINYVLEKRSIYPEMSSHCWDKAKEFILPDICAKYADVYHGIINQN